MSGFRYFQFGFSWTSVTDELETFSLDEETIADELEGNFTLDDEETFAAVLEDGCCSNESEEDDNAAELLDSCELSMSKFSHLPSLQS